MKLAVSLGTNLGKREENLKHALHLLHERVGDVVACSSFYTTEPVGFKSEHLFLNAAALLECSKPVMEVLLLTQQIEKEMGRKQKSTDGGYADRIIDIDLLFYGNELCQTPQLTLPHPHLHERRFVLEPLAEIVPVYIHPVLHESYRELLHRLNKARLEVADTSSPEILHAVNHLLPQLSASARPMTAESLGALISRTPDTRLVLLRDEERHICGMATLCLCLMPTGCKAWVEDVVVDEACRGRGYGRQLLHYIIEEARQAGAASINLTSRPERLAANRLYQSFGFEKRETNVYKMVLD